MTTETLEVETSRGVPYPDRDRAKPCQIEGAKVAQRLNPGVSAGLSSACAAEMSTDHPAVYHLPFPTAAAMMRRAAGVPHERAQPVAIGSSFPRAMEPVGNAGFQGKNAS